MERRAFTLLEVIVTTAIIMALAAITVPALGKARSTARRAMCTSQVHALVMSCASYAADNRDFLPPGPRELTPDGAFANDPDRGSPLELFCAARVGAGNLFSQNGWYGQGLLWQQQVMTEGRIYYCPEVERKGWGYAFAWPQNMAMAPTQAGEKAVVTGSYLYRGGYSSAVGTRNGTLSASSNNAGEPVFADSPMYGTMWHPGGYVVGYLGGQVEFRRFTKSPVSGIVVGPLWDAVRDDAVVTTRAGLQ